MTTTSARFRSAAEVVYVLCTATLDSLAARDADGAAQPIIDQLPERDAREALACLTGLFSAAVIGLAGEGADELLRHMTIDAGGA